MSLWNHLNNYGAIAFTGLLRRALEKLITAFIDRDTKNIEDFKKEHTVISVMSDLENIRLALQKAGFEHMIPFEDILDALAGRDSDR